ncbi:hypothetical protein Bca52824_033966 [Brassica carinata]|uniref:RNase H type-1 domain-containing protein n=1 Tax=Brassica carinata TaxID=52824 RepID=A0A8X7SEY1_BRACI|nr:hypothetical protein Bca52824_033966 [Brassica carinata]
MEKIEERVYMKGAMDPVQSLQPGWVLCEFDMDWSKGCQDMGAAWIVKDERGKVIEHSRRAFSAIHKPGQWPLLQFHASEIRRELQALEAWELRIGSVASIRCASFIAQSVKVLGFFQSYVAAGSPRWLDHLYANERLSSGN